MPFFSRSRSNSTPLAHSPLNDTNPFATPTTSEDTNDRPGTSVSRSPSPKRRSRASTFTFKTATVSPASSPPTTSYGTSSTGCECDEKSSNNGGNQPISQALPTREDMDAIARLPIYSSTGDERTFGSLYMDAEKEKGVAIRRHMIIFIRNFFCGSCQEYIRSLSTLLPPTTLLAATPATSLTIIGCGAPELISAYISTTACPYPIYADPSRSLYTSLSLTRTLDLGPTKPAYIKQSLLSGVVTSILQGLSSGTHALKGGDMLQVGGEFVFELRSSWGGASWDGLDERKARRGSGLRRVHSQEQWMCTWAHRMRNTRDHSEVEVLKAVLGVQDGAARAGRKWSQGLREVGRWRRGRRGSRGSKDEKEKVLEMKERKEPEMASLRPKTPTMNFKETTKEARPARSRSVSLSSLSNFAPPKRPSIRSRTTSLSRSKSGYENLNEDGPVLTRQDKGKGKAIEVEHEVQEIPELDEGLRNRASWKVGESSRSGSAVGLVLG